MSTKVAVSKEVKIGVLALVAGAVLYIGFNFLKGKEIFSNTKKYFVIFDAVDGLKVSSPVVLNGVTVGQVSRRTLRQNPGKTDVVVEIEIDGSIRLGKDSTKAILQSLDLLGSKAVMLTTAKRLDVNGKFYAAKDTIQVDRLQSLKDELMSKVNPVVEKMDSTLYKVNHMMSPEFEKYLHQTSKNIAALTYNLNEMITESRGNLNTISSQLSSLTNAIAQTNKSVQPILTKMDAVADSLKSSEMKQTIANANAALASLNEISRKINSGQGSLGKLMNDPTFANNMTETMANLNLLAQDLKWNPKHYLKPLGKKPPKDSATPAGLTPRGN